MFDKIKWARGVDGLRKIQDQCRPVVASHGSSRWVPVNYIWADTSCKVRFVTEIICVLEIKEDEDGVEFDWLHNEFHVRDSSVGT
ncbi:hypothetical protein RUM43_013961 [Polyplax serrata]|uniref:Uncharacterized protein n=1 Tax=Polyplax serrata TaxID=468196 RepID=A0AAN8S2P5_POLSC